MREREDKDIGRSLRHNGTATEAILWKYLKSRGVAGLKFRRQYQIGPYYMDFFCHEIMLCVELDGSVHEERNIEIHDNIRTRFLNDMGITVLRFSNDVVYHNVSYILECIENFAKHPVLLPGYHKNEMISGEEEI